MSNLSISLYRVRFLANKCRNRGGDCPCSHSCQAIRDIDNILNSLNTQKFQIEQKIDEIELMRKRLITPPATLRKNFTFDERYKPVMYFGSDEVIFGYEDDSGEWIEANCWPFNESFVWYDDCERFGIKVV